MLAKLFSFTRVELKVLLEAWFVLLKWDLLISFTRYENWRDKIGGLHKGKHLQTEPQTQQFTLEQAHTPETSATTLTTIAQVNAIIKLSEIAGRFHLRKMNCLRRCIAQEKMLEKRGVNTQMHIGVRFENQQLKAHAWLTYQGEVINDSADVAIRYSELKVNNQQALLRQMA